MKHIIKQVAPEHAELMYYFDCDAFNAESGDYNNTLFIIEHERYNRYEGLNGYEFNRLREQCEELFDRITEMIEHNEDYTWQEVFDNAGIEYDPDKIPALISWYESSDSFNHYQDSTIENVSTLLCFQTGKTWNVLRVNGYSQGDVVYVVYCDDNYSRDEAMQCGEIWLGCGSELSVTTINDEGNEDCTYGYILADCQCIDDPTIKHLICEYADINPDDTTLQMIDSTRTITEYIYREC